MLQSSGCFKAPRQASDDSCQQDVNGQATQDTSLESSAVGTATDNAMGQRAKPRGLPSKVEQTVSRLNDNTESAADSDTADDAADVLGSPQQKAASIHSAGDGTAEQSGSAHAQDSLEVAGKGDGRVAQQSALAAEGSPPKQSHVTGQGRPPLSPVRQSQTALSNASTPGKDINVTSGAQAIDMNVICNPLFTEPAGARRGDSARQQLPGIGRCGVPDQASVQQQEGVSVQHGASSNDHGPEMKSPPSKLQQSLRMLMQRHNEDS